MLRKPGSYNTPVHRQKILDAARESIILLKNEKNQLPLSQEKTKKVLVIGDNANRIQSYGGIAPEILEKQNAYRAGVVKKTAEGGYDTVIFVDGQNHFQDLEGHDRPDMKLPYAQDKLIGAVNFVHKKHLAEYYQ